MRVKLTGLIIILALAAAPAWAQTKNQLGEPCANGDSADAIISACTALIQSGQKTDPADLSFDYVHRADAYKSKGLRDQAIADYREAMKIYPEANDWTEVLQSLGATP